MKFEVLDSFHGDYARLSDAEKERFRKVLPAFVAACDRYAVDASASWPASLRVKDVEGAPGVFEMTWSFAGLGGRATFEWTAIEGALDLRWRRIGGHRVFKKP